MKPKNGIDELHIDHRYNVIGATGIGTDYIQLSHKEVVIEPVDITEEFDPSTRNSTLHLDCKTVKDARQVFSKISGINLDKLPEFDRTKKCRCRKFIRKLFVTVSEPGLGDWYACTKCGGRR